MQLAIIGLVHAFATWLMEINEEHCRIGNQGKRKGRLRSYWIDDVQTGKKEKNHTQVDISVICSAQLRRDTICPSW